MSALQEQIAVDQRRVFFAEFSERVVLQGKEVRALLVDKAAAGGNGTVVVEQAGVHVLRKRLQVMADDVDWIPVAGMDLELNGNTWRIEHLGHELPAEVYDLHLYRYAA